MQNALFLTVSALWMGSAVSQIDDAREAQLSKRASCCCARFSQLLRSWRALIDRRRLAAVAVEVSVTGVLPFPFVGPCSGAGSPNWCVLFGVSRCHFGGYTDFHGFPSRYMSAFMAGAAGVAPPGRQDVGQSHAHSPPRAQPPSLPASDAAEAQRMATRLQHHLAYGAGGCAARSLAPTALVELTADNISKLRVLHPIEE